MHYQISLVERRNVSSIRSVVHKSHVVHKHLWDKELHDIHKRELVNVCDSITQEILQYQTFTTYKTTIYGVHNSSASAKNLLHLLQRTTLVSTNGPHHHIFCSAQISCSAQTFMRYTARYISWNIYGVHNSSSSLWSAQLFSKLFHSCYEQQSCLRRSCSTRHFLSPPSSQDHS